MSVCVSMTQRSSGVMFVANCVNWVMRTKKNTANSRMLFVSVQSTLFDHIKMMYSYSVTSLIYDQTLKLYL